jgi:hypothetical protein
VAQVATTPSQNVIGTRWTKFGNTLPHALVSALDYTLPFKDPAGTDRGDVLVVGLRGRGVWMLANASQSVVQPSVLTINGDGKDNQFTVRLNPDRQDPLEPWIDVVQVDDDDQTTQRVVVSVPQAALERIVINGLGGDDGLLVDSRIRVLDDIQFDGGKGRNSLLILGVPGDVVFRTGAKNRRGDVLIGGGAAATDPTQLLAFKNVDVLQASLPEAGADNLLAKV